MAWTIDDLDSPSVLIDLDKVEANLKRAQAYADSHGVRLRPHIKTHKLPELAKLQLDLGAIGITCQKLGEAEVMADAGISDILLTFNLLGRPKMAKLVDLARLVKMTVVVDNAVVAGELSQAMDAAGLALDVLVECDTGADRCGVQSPEDALALAREIDRLPGLRFAGIMTYPPKGRTQHVNAWLTEAKATIERGGIDCATVSNGGTPDLFRAHEVSVATEHRPGTYVYSDRSQVAGGLLSLEDCALRVLTTVVSRPTDNRAIFDAGSKTLTSDLLGMPDYGHVVEYPQLVIEKFSEEHAHVDCSKSNARPRVGERISVIPNHACVVSNMFDTVYGVRGDRVERAFRVAARGLVQ